jgi:mannose-6-phosphate isomerase-like protein (cupin superfamily)
MRKIVVLSMITLDGVMQAPGGPEEDTSGGFKYGGWVAPYFDEVYGKVMEKQLKPADLLLGRKTFEIFADYWPEHENGWPGINNATKYVMSKTRKKSDWENSVFLKGVTIGKAILEPGYVCEINESCMTPHTFYMVSGRMKLVMDDETQDECGSGDVVMIPSGHNMWVIGNEPIVAIAFENYSK